MGLKEEFKLVNFALNHSDPQRFVASQWGYPRFYLLWRIFWALFHTSWLVTSIVVARETMASPSLGVAIWFIYLSNWTYLLLTVSTVLDAVVVLYAKVKRKDILKGLPVTLPWYMKISWLLNSVLLGGCLHVSAMYWIFVFKYHNLTLLRFIFHAINSFYVLSNLLVTAMPVRVYHMIYPIIYGIIYTVFSVVYHTLGGTNVSGDPYIYKILDWSQWTRTLSLVCLSTFVALPCVHVLVYCIHAFRLYVNSRLHKRRDEFAFLESSPDRNIRHLTGIFVT